MNTRLDEWTAAFPLRHTLSCKARRHEGSYQKWWSLSTSFGRDKRERSTQSWFALSPHSSTCHRQHTGWLVDSSFPFRSSKACLLRGDATTHWSYPGVNKAGCHRIECLAYRPGGACYDCGVEIYVVCSELGFVASSWTYGRLRLG